MAYEKNNIQNIRAGDKSFWSVVYDRQTCDRGNVEADESFKDC